MTPRLTLFTATLVQDSALSVSGLDRESTADQPFALVNGVPTLVGRGLKGAVVAMAKRFFDRLPHAVSDAVKQGEKRALRRSAWEFSDATTTEKSQLRAGVGIRHKTGARAGGMLYDREVIPSGTRWELTFRVDWSQVPVKTRDDEGVESEGILGYILAEHWAKDRCWLGGGAARGLGWCHIEHLKAYRFDEASHDVWVASGRPRKPELPAIAVPTVRPTRSWFFRTLDLTVSFGEYKPDDPAEAAWGLDMLAIGPHDGESTLQPTGDGIWARPAWAPNADEPNKWRSDGLTPTELATDRAILMEGAKPLLPGASVRGPLRHAFSRAENSRSGKVVVNDPNQKRAKISDDDPGGKVFGTAKESSRILIRDSRAEGDWSAAKLHMHAEDEFSAGSYGSAKRDAVRLLKGTFPVRIVVEGASLKEVEPLVELIDRQVALGALGHLPIGGHKTRGAGAGIWAAQPWHPDDVVSSSRTWVQPPGSHAEAANDTERRADFLKPLDSADVWVRPTSGAVSEPLTLASAAKLAKTALGDKLVAWWCDPTIDLNLRKPAPTFGYSWPSEGDLLNVDEVAFYTERAVWRAARVANGARYVLIEELDSKEVGAKKSRVTYTPARLHDSARFSSATTGHGMVLLREWHVEDGILGFTITKEQR